MLDPPLGEMLAACSRCRTPCDTGLAWLNSPCCPPACVPCPCVLPPAAPALAPGPVPGVPAPTAGVPARLEVALAQDVVPAAEACGLDIILSGEVIMDPLAGVESTSTSFVPVSQHSTEATAMPQDRNTTSHARVHVLMRLLLWANLSLTRCSSLRSLSLPFSSPCCNALSNSAAISGTALSNKSEMFASRVAALTAARSSIAACAAANDACTLRSMAATRSASGRGGPASIPTPWSKGSSHHHVKQPNDV